MNKEFGDAGIAKDVAPRPDVDGGDSMVPISRSVGRAQTIGGAVVACILLAIAGKWGVDNNIFPDPPAKSINDGKGDRGRNSNFELRDFLNAGFNGQVLGPDGQNIAPLLAEIGFFIHSTKDVSNPVGRVIAREGAKTRWFPVVDKLYPDDSADLTALNRTEWKNPCDIVGPSSAVITTVQRKPDGTFSVTEWIEQTTDRGRKFIAITKENGLSGLKEQIVSFDKNTPAFCEVPS